jgi:hypothetical protein
MIRSRASEIGGACSTYGGEGSGMPGFGGETQGKGLLGTPRPRREDTLKQIFKKDHMEYFFTFLLLLCISGYLDISYFALI